MKPWGSQVCWPASQACFSPAHPFTPSGGVCVRRRGQMGEEQGFLQAMAAEPNDDRLRLTYADWLEERGDPRGEFVRVCQGMRAAPVWSDRYWQLKARRNQLRAQCPLPWLEATGYDGGHYDPV